MLSFGNCLNAGTPKGKALGFRLSTLNKFAESKDQASVNNMLYYIWKLAKSIDDRIESK